MSRINNWHYFYHFLVISIICVAWIVCLCNWHQIICWSCNVAEMHPIKSEYTTQVFDHCLIGLRDILQVDCWSFRICFISGLQILLFLQITSIWYSDVTVLQ